MLCYQHWIIKYNGEHCSCEWIAWINYCQSFTFINYLLLFIYGAEIDNNGNCSTIWHWKRAWKDENVIILYKSEMHFPKLKEIWAHSGIDVWYKYGCQNHNMLHRWATLRPLNYLQHEIMMIFNKVSFMMHYSCTAHYNKYMNAIFGVLHAMELMVLPTRVCSNNYVSISMANNGFTADITLWCHIDNGRKNYYPRKHELPSNINKPYIMMSCTVQLWKTY